MPNCENCDDRGYFTGDMMGTSFTPCIVCETYELCDDGIHVRRKQKQDIAIAGWASDIDEKFTDTKGWQANLYW